MQITLTADQLEHVIGQPSQEAGILEAWKTINPGFDGAEKVDPTEFAIPADQWKTIADRLMRLDDQTPIGSANWCLTWVNIGPSSFELG